MELFSIAWACGLRDNYNMANLDKNSNVQEDMADNKEDTRRNNDDVMEIPVQLSHASEDIIENLDVARRGVNLVKL